MLEQHLDAIIAAVIAGAVVGLGSILVHARTVGRLEATMSALHEDVKEMKVGISRVNKRFHWLNGFSMGLYGAVKLLCEKAGVPMVYLQAYDYSHEDEVEE